MHILSLFLHISCTTKTTDSAVHQDTTAESNEIIDSDNDGLSDDEEAMLGTDPTNHDSDGDGLADSQEVQRETDPNNPDSDGDGFNDFYEVYFQSDPLNADDFPLVPNMTLWKHQNPQFSIDECNLSSILEEEGGDIFTFFPQDFDILDASPEFFLFKIMNSSPNGQGSMCSIIEGDFICEPLYNEVPLESSNVTLVFDIIKGGTILALEQMDFSIELKLTMCEGDPFACGLLSISGVQLNCSSFVMTQASPE